MPHYRSHCIYLTLIFLGLPACVIQAPNKYANTSNNIEVAPKDRRSFEVEANKAWQKPGIFVVKGAKVHIRADGEWSPWPEIGMKCGPDGDESATFSGEAAWIPACALMARLGTNGRPFLVGQEIEFTAKDSGHIYFAINDPFFYLGNNTGSLDVNVTVDFPEETPTTTGNNTP